MTSTEREGSGSPQLILPVGTRVVSRIDIYSKDGELRRARGAVGTIVKAPLDATHAYLIRFPDSAEVILHRHEMSILKHLHEDGLKDLSSSAFGHLHEFVIYRCVVGSQAYGLDHENSDTDRRGIYLPPAELHWALYGVPEQLDCPETEECYFELQKFLVLALKANPNILECLYTPLVEFKSPVAEELLSMREEFLSKLVYQTFNGYVLSQFKKLEQDLRVHNNIKWKHAMHLIRLLLSGIVALKDGYVPVRVDDHRDRLLDIRHGRSSWEAVNAWRLELHAQFDQAHEHSKLPDRPDYAKANDFLVQARRRMVDVSEGNKQ